MSKVDLTNKQNNSSNREYGFNVNKQPNKKQTNRRIRENGFIVNQIRLEWL